MPAPTVCDEDKRALQRQRLAAHGYTIQSHSNGLQGWWALLPGHTEFMDDGKGGQNYLGFFSNEHDLLDEISDLLDEHAIVGTFFKQRWGGRKNDDAIACGEETFDATQAILLLPHEQLLELQDGSENTDEIGRAHVPWTGPCEVLIVNSICEYFKVAAIEDITPEALAQARAAADPQPAQEATVTISIKLNLRLQPGASVAEFLEDLDYSVDSQTPGVLVRHTELVDSDYQEPSAQPDAPRG